MSRLGANLRSLQRYRRYWDHLTPLTRNAEPTFLNIPATRLKANRAFGSNPGNLRMLSYVPAGLPSDAPLVVVLHGCQQDAAHYDHSAAWSQLADARGFAVLYPEQKPANNPKGCFNWFLPGDTRRGAGEAASILQMIETMQARHRTSRDKTFITGLSAGGAMASTMLAIYPEIFAGGAIIAGLPYGAASNVSQAFKAMFEGSMRSGEEWASFARRESGHKGKWPRVSVWQGDADATVVPSNAREIGKQWLALHGSRVVTATPEEERAEGHIIRRWRDADGAVVLENHHLSGLGHGTPLDVAAGIEKTGPFMLDAKVSSTWQIARFWGLA